MNFRKLIEQAMYEVRDEFAAIVQRKLAELMGDAEIPDRPRAKRAPGRPAKARKPARGRTRAPADHMAELREKVIAALRSGDSMKKQQIMRAAKVSDDEGLRVAAILRKLKDEGVVTMKGQKAVATYTVRAKEA